MDGRKKETREGWREAGDEGSEGVMEPVECPICFEQRTDVEILQHASAAGRDVSAHRACGMLLQAARRMLTAAGLHAATLHSTPWHHAPQPSTPVKRSATCGNRCMSAANDPQEPVVPVVPRRGGMARGDTLHH